MRDYEVEITVETDAEFIDEAVERTKGANGTFRGRDGLVEQLNDVYDTSEPIYSEGGKKAKVTIKVKCHKN